MYKKEKSFLGQGWAFPVHFNDANRTVAMVSEETDIRQSLSILFTTRTGERVMLPTYGCDLDQFVFESMDNTTQHYLEDLIETAIINWEPRIILDLVKLDMTEYLTGVLRIHIDYRIRSTNTRSNIVFPFYFMEGTYITNSKTM